MHQHSSGPSAKERRARSRTRSGAKGRTQPTASGAVPVGKLIDVPYPGVAALPTNGTSVLPIAPRGAVADGSFARVAIVIGANRDEGRTFQQGSIGWQEADYAKWINKTFGEKADKVLAQYPWPKDADKYTGAYLAGAVVTDSGHIAGIGGCATLKLISDADTGLCEIRAGLRLRVRRQDRAGSHARVRRL